MGTVLCHSPQLKGLREVGGGEVVFILACCRLRLALCRAGLVGAI